jgi:hypothetical protein
MICCFFLEGFFELFVGFFISGSPGSFTLCERRGYDADEYPVNAKCTVPKGTCGLAAMPWIRGVKNVRASLLQVVAQRSN